MSVSLSEEQEELRRYVRQWLDERAPLDEVRRIMETDEGFDHQQWKELAELGWLGMAIDETHGGAGYGFGELAVLAEEMGRSLYPSPFMATVVMGTSLLESLATEEQKSELLPAIQAGEKRLAVARGTFTSDRDSDDWLLSGSARFVLDGHTADVLLVVASAGGAEMVFMVDGGAEGVGRSRLDVLDLTRPQAEVKLSSAPATPLGDGSADVAGALQVMQDRAVATLAMEQVGGAQACLDMSVAYAKDRHQFGRPIGSFQAIKHMCADLLVAVESARSAAYHLASAVEDDPDEVAVAAPLAKSYCSEAYFRAAADTIQIHGGIGFTWEHDAHLYLKRAKSSQLLFGDAPAHRRRLAGRLGIE